MSGFNVIFFDKRIETHKNIKTLLKCLKHLNSTKIPLPTTQMSDSMFVLDSL